MKPFLTAMAIGALIIPAAANANVDVSAGVNAEGSTSGAGRTGNSGASIGTNSVNQNRLGGILGDARVNAETPSAAVDTRAGWNAYGTPEAQRRAQEERAEMNRKRGNSQIGVGIDASGGSSVNKTVSGKGSASGSIQR
jgi:hypothetical protein